MWSSIKFSAFYIVSYVFVNMIFIHFYDFIRFQVLGGIFGSGVAVLGIYRFADLQDGYRIMRVANRTLEAPDFYSDPPFLHLLTGMVII
jgi:hypothetical protein